MSVTANPTAEATASSYLELILRKTRSWDLILLAALLALFSFSVPGRVASEDGGGKDIIGLIKFLLRAVAVPWLGMQLLISRKSATLAWLLNPRQEFLPWIAFMLWAAVTVTWSPLKTVSVGQWLGLVALLTLAISVSDRVQRACDQSLSGGREFAERLVAQLGLILIAYCLLVLSVHAVAPWASGLDRSVDIEGAHGFVHPTAAGATASLGLLLALHAIATRKWSEFRWSILLVSSLLLLFLSNSRAAILCFAFCAGIYWLLVFDLRWKANSLIGVAIGCFLIILLDPGLQALETVFGNAVGYFTRGQTKDQLVGISGRGELWQAMWAEYWRSPVVGHGYFVTTPDGKLDVWGRATNHDAHNLFFQALVTTGLVGAGLFLWATASVVRMVGVAWAPMLNGAKIHSLDMLSGVIFVWFACWGLGCTTFLGPIRPESVVFFLTLGIAIGLAVASFRQRQKLSVSGAEI